MRVWTTSEVPGFLRHKMYDILGWTDTNVCLKNEQGEEVWTSHDVWIPVNK
ncbi:MAG: hypothetical protein HRU26_08955 [Psychroserpens sp.]|nr:hypothetical protein [Psychroserpens sp.]